MRWRPSLSYLAVGILLAAAVLATNSLTEVNVVVFPDVASSTFSYNFVFSNSPSCTSLLNVSRSITTNTAGRGNATLDLTGLADTPAYLCTYRSGVLVDTQSLNPNAFEAGNITAVNGTPGYPAVFSGSGSIIAAAIDYAHISNVPDFAFQTALDGLYANFSGNQTLFNTTITGLQTGIASLITNFTANQSADNASITNLQVRVNTINGTYALQASLANLILNFTGNQTLFNTSIQNLQIRVDTINRTALFNIDDVVNASNLNVSATGTHKQVLSLNQSGGLNWTNALLDENDAVDESNLNVSNAGTTGQVLTLNSTGGMNWTTPVRSYQSFNATEGQQVDSAGAASFGPTAPINTTLYLEANSRYQIECVFLQSAAATTTGVQMRFNTTGSPTNFRYSMTYYTSATAEANCQGTNVNSNTCAATASAGATVTPARYYAFILTSNNPSVFTAEYATEIDLSAARIEQGSFCRATKWF